MLTKSLFTLSDAIAAIANIVLRYGADHVGADPNGGCTYYTLDHHALKPVCIVGVLFADLGILRATMGSAGPGDALGACLLDSEVWTNAETMGVTFTDDAREFLLAVQREQDNRTAWGDCLTSVVSRAQRDAEENLRTTNPYFTLSDRVTAVSLPQAAKANDKAFMGEALAPWERELLHAADPNL